MTDPNGRNLKELSVGIRHWLKRHLPFKILRYGITNILTGTEMTEEDTDNKFIGLGLSLGWDNRYKRVLITKKIIYLLRTRHITNMMVEGSYIMKQRCCQTIRKYL